MSIGVRSREPQLWWDLKTAIVGNHTSSCPVAVLCVCFPLSRVLPWSLFATAFIPLSLDCGAGLFLDGVWLMNEVLWWWKEPMSCLMCRPEPIDIFDERDCPFWWWKRFWVIIRTIDGSAGQILWIWLTGGCHWNSSSAWGWELFLGTRVTSCSSPWIMAKVLAQLHPWKANVTRQVAHTWKQWQPSFYNHQNGNYCVDQNLPALLPFSAAEEWACPCNQIFLAVRLRYVHRLAPSKKL